MADPELEAFKKQLIDSIQQNQVAQNDNNKNLGLGAVDWHLYDEAEIY